jgi:hypothetical protein
MMEVQSVKKQRLVGKQVDVGTTLRVNTAQGRAMIERGEAVPAGTLPQGKGAVRKVVK